MPGTRPPLPGAAVDRGAGTATAVRRVAASEKVAMINPATFVLMVIIGTSPPQQRGEFHSYHHCYEAAQGEIANLGPDVRWDCVLKHRDGEQE
jgi:hypothetical protein